jgi:tetratricopeptide (TPR) repeat protein
VLYRSYLWAPGIAMIVGWAIDRVPRRVAMALLVPALLVLGWEARDRLHTFSDGLELWQDAVAKLPAQPVPGGHRPLYQLGREYLYRGRPQDALAQVARCNVDYPKTFDCYFARAAIHIELEQYQEALPSIATAIALRPREGAARHHLGLILENVGCTDEALAQYRLAINLGFKGAAYRIQRIESPGTGLLAPGAVVERQVDCAALVARTAQRPG